MGETRRVYRVFDADSTLGDLLCADVLDHFWDGLGGVIMSKIGRQLVLCALLGSVGFMLVRIVYLLDQQDKFMLLVPLMLFFVLDICVMVDIIFYYRKLGIGFGLLVLLPYVVLVNHFTKMAELVNCYVVMGVCVWLTLTIWQRKEELSNFERVWRGFFARQTTSLGLPLTEKYLWMLVGIFVMVALIMFCIAAVMAGYIIGGAVGAVIGVVFDLGFIFSLFSENKV